MSGSDLAWNDQMEGLKEAGARVYVGHNAVQMAPPGSLVPDALVVSSAVGPGNVEVDAARALQVPMCASHHICLKNLLRVFLKITHCIQFNP